MTAPPLERRKQPGLSETLTGPKHPHRCQSCGCHAADASQPLERWIECDEWDRRTGTVVVLCDRCAKRLIEPHPRLYVAIPAHAPRSGVMDICADCPRRDGVRCTSPLLRYNGGPGMKITVEEPAAVHLKMGKPGRSGFYRLWKEPTACAGKDAAK